MKKSTALIVSFAGLMLFSAGTVFGESSMPNMAGNWEARSYGHHHEQKGFFTNAQADGKWVISKQQGRFFYGERTYTERHLSNKKVKEGFSGVISRDGKRVYLVDHDEDIMFGEFLPDGSIELVMMNDGDRNNHSRIGILEIQRAK